MLRFLKSKVFFINLSIAIVAIALLLYVAFAMLGSYTHHGEKLPLPDLRDMTISDAKKLLEKQGLRLQIEDSVYVENALPGMIVTQVPEPFYINTKTGDKSIRYVKEGRKVYLTINKLSPPKLSFPNLIGKSKRIANSTLKTMGMEMEISYKTSSTGEDFVLEQLINGNPIEEGDKIKMGSKITIVLSKLSTKSTYVPRLTGLSVIDAQNKLNDNSINIGRISGDCSGCENKYDTLNAYVVKQFPTPNERINEGGEVDIIISVEEPQKPE